MNRKVWTKKEVTYLRRVYARHGAIHAARRLGCPSETVERKARKLGLRWGGRRPWRLWEQRYLRLYYNKGRSPGRIARALRRSKSSVIAQARVLHLVGPKARPWTPHERELLRTLYPDRTVPLTVIAVRLNRSTVSIVNAATQMGLRRPHHDHVWTAEEHAYLLKHYKSKMFKEIAAHLGLSTDAVALHANRHGILRRAPTRHWSSGELEYVRQHYPTTTAKEIARVLGRTEKSVAGMAERMGVSKKVPRR
jgi:hypothetical protein